MEPVWIRKCLQSTHNLVRQRRGWDRRGNYDAHGRKCSHWFRMGYLHEEPRGSTGHGTRGLQEVPAIRVCSKPVMIMMMSTASECRTLTTTCRYFDSATSIPLLQFNERQALPRHGQSQFAILHLEGFRRWKFRRLAQLLDLCLAGITWGAHLLIGEVEISMVAVQSRD